MVRHTWCVAAFVLIAMPVLGQSASPLPGASFAQNYRPKPAFRQQTRAYAPPAPSKVDVTVVARGLEHPWSLAFLPGGDFLVTERPGRLRLVSADGRVSAPIQGMPAIKSMGTKGLHDVVLDPDFQQNRMIYLSYFAPNPGYPAPDTDQALKVWTQLPPKVRETHKIGFERVARARLSEDGRRLERFEVILDGPALGVRRLVFARDGTLFVAADTPGTGETPTGPEPQQLDNRYGKILRIKTDGSIPHDNPFRNRKGVRPEIYAYGLRDPEGATIDPNTGELWTAENGPRGGDEVNRIVRGKNYGFPTISYGLDYKGRKLGTGKLRAVGMEQPVYFWTPSMATSGLTFYNGNLFPAWRGDLFLGGLAAKRLIRLHLERGEVVAEEHLLVERGKRIRDVRQGPDGALYLLTDEMDGELLRLTPTRR